jgi:hypothetical protein
MGDAAARAKGGAILPAQFFEPGTISLIKEKKAP